METIALPTLTRDGLVLRGPTMGDFDAYAEVLASPRSRGLNGPYTRADAWKDWCVSQAEWVMFGIGPLSIEVEGSFAGVIVISHHPDFPEPELGWVLTAAAEGKGIAAAASRIYRDWAETRRPLSSLVSYILPDNARAIALAERLGAYRDDTAQRPWPTATVYRYTTDLKRSR
ncbi:MAG: GNAT family N-acetyltransferase [Planctomycetota bacterium]